MKKRISLLLTYLILITVTISLSSCNCSSLSDAIDEIKTIDSKVIESESLTDSASDTYNNDTSTTNEDTQTTATTSQAGNVTVTLPSGSNYEYIKSAHDWIIINTNYDTTQPIDSIPSSSFSADGVFINHVAVCQGYALAFEELMDEKGIECKVVYGQAGGISHAWNIVKLDGNWYHIDTTWDDPLIGGINGTGTANLSYDYFLVPDVVIKQNHTISYVIDNNNTRDKQNAPACTSNTYVYYPKSYGISTAILLNSINEMPEKYYESLHSGNASVTFFYPETESYSDSIISDLQYYVASRDGSCSGFSINVSDIIFVGYKYITLIPN